MNEITFHNNSININTIVTLPWNKMEYIFPHLTEQLLITFGQNGVDNVFDI